MHEAFQLRAGSRPPPPSGVTASFHGLTEPGCPFLRLIVEQARRADVVAGLAAGPKLRHCSEITAPSGLFSCPPAALQKGLHIPSVALPHDALLKRIWICAPFCTLQPAKIPAPPGSLISEQCLTG